jgi:hypothetical protein
MYVPFGSACDLPNSSTPMTQARIDAQNRRVARAGQKFTDGNEAMAAIVDALTPPAPTGTCEDLTTSRSMFAAQVMAAPRPAGAGVAVGSSGSAVLSLPSRGASYWMQKGGPSSYPYGALQLNVGRLVPAWDCSAAPSMGDRFADALKSPTFWGVLAIAGLGLYAVAGDNKR